MTDHENPDWARINIWQVTARLADFGLAKMHTSGDKSFTTSQICGSFKYMAPEMVKGYIDNNSQQLKIHGRLDIFSAGVITYYLFTGKLKDGKGLYMNIDHI